jgi:maltose-binding protein MalE
MRVRSRTPSINEEVEPVRFGLGYFNRSGFYCAASLIFFICIFAATLFTGCEKKEETLEIIIWEQMDPEEQILLNQHLESFKQKHAGLQISTDHFETDVLHSQFQTAALAGGGPDLVYGPSDKVGPYSVMNLIYPLEDQFDDEFWQRFEKGSIAYLEGHIYAVPDQIGNHLMLLYNKDLVNRQPQDSDDWIEMCKEATRDNDDDGFPDVYGLVFNYNEPFWLVPFLGGYGGWLVDDKFNPTLNTPAMVGALNFLADMRNKHKIVPRESNYPMSDTMFKMGQAAFLINGPWSFKGYLKAGINMGVMPLPVIKETGKHPTPTVSSRGYSINANVDPDKLALVKELLQHLTSEEVQKSRMTELLILPSLSSLYKEAVLTDNEILKGSKEQALLGRPMPVVPELRAIWDAIRPFYQSVLGGEMTPEKAAEKMQLKAEKTISEMKK